MKYLMIFCLLTSLIQTVNAATLPLHFISGSKVFYVGAPETTVKLTIYEESKESWAILTVDSRDPNSYQTQENALIEKYPNSKIQRVLGRGQGKPMISIAALNLTGEAEWIPYQNGPGLTKSFTLSEPQTQKLVKASDLGLSIEGTVQAYTPEYRVVESVGLPVDVCKSLLKGGNTFEKIVRNFPEISRKIDGLKTQYPTTKVNLKSSVLEKCFDLSTPTLIRSFKDLLDVEVISLNPEQIIGETRLETPTERVGSFSSELPKQITSTIGG